MWEKGYIVDEEIEGRRFPDGFLSVGGGSSDHRSTWCRRIIRAYGDPKPAGPCFLALANVLAMIAERPWRRKKRNNTSLAPAPVHTDVPGQYGFLLPRPAFDSLFCLAADIHPCPLTRHWSNNSSHTPAALVVEDLGPVVRPLLCPWTRMGVFRMRQRRSCRRRALRQHYASSAVS